MAYCFNWEDQVQKCAYHTLFPPFSLFRRFFFRFQSVSQSVGNKPTNWKDRDVRNLITCWAVGHHEVPRFRTKWYNFLPIGNSTFAPTEIPGFLSQMESAQEVTFYTLVFSPIKYKSMTYTLASHQCGRMVLYEQFGMFLLITVLITIRVPDRSNWLQPTLLNNLKIALWCFSSTVADYVPVVHHL